MKKTYHFCLSAGDEVMFRDQEDYNRGFNCFALALYKTGSTGIVEAFMATHCHLMAETDDPTGLMYHMRMPYSKMFNNKYFKFKLMRLVLLLTLRVQNLSLSLLKKIAIL